MTDLSPVPWLVWRLGVGLDRAGALWPAEAPRAPALARGRAPPVLELSRGRAGQRTGPSFLARGPTRWSVRGPAHQVAHGVARRGARTSAGIEMGNFGSV